MDRAPAAVTPLSKAGAAAELLRRRKARASLAEFVRQGWPILEPGTPLIWNWHLDLLCDALERQIRGEPEYRRLLLLIPPGTMKSLLVSVFAPAWEWLSQPSRRKLFLSNDDELVTRDSRRTRDLVTSAWYEKLKPADKPWTLTQDQNEKTNFENTQHGVRQCQSILAKITGKRGDDVCIDDPLDAKAVVNGSMHQVKRRLQEVANIIDKALPSRVNDLATARWTLIMQRLAQDDPAGRAIKEGGWKIVQLQMEFEPGNELNHPRDPRKEAGELLFSAKFPRDEVERLKVKLTVRHYSAQYQQRPTAEEGTYLLRTYFAEDTRYDEQPHGNIYISSDFAVSLPEPGTEPDFTEFGVWSIPADKHLYALDWWYGQTTANEWVERLLDLVKRWQPLCFFGESGVIRRAVEPTLTTRMQERNVFCRVEWLASMSDKAARGRPFQAMAAQKRVHFPKRAPWADRVVEQCIGFPTEPHDDGFDACSLIGQAVDQAHPAVLVAPPAGPSRRDYNRKPERVGGWKVV